METYRWKDARRRKSAAMLSNGRLHFDRAWTHAKEALIGKEVTLELPVLHLLSLVRGHD